MDVVEIIRKKRDGGRNSRQELRHLIQGALQGSIPSYQVSAWLMAAFLKGLTERETLDLTRIMVHSGRVLDFTGWPTPKVDKHSTGGVGDKTSLVVAPLAAALGLAVPMISGRGLGHTGGTLDKLESIPGFRTELSLKELQRQVREVGVAIVGQSDELAPADRLLYALRDVTATVESVPLIVASILSKKVAAGIDGLVLDVKTGWGAFMKKEAQALALARSLVRVGEGLGKKVVALVTDMSQPLGLKVGNALEVEEAIQVLQGGGPEDLRSLCLKLAAYMLVVGGKVRDAQEGEELAAGQLQNGNALRKFQEMVRAQGGKAEVVSQPSAHLPASRFRLEWDSPHSGYLVELRADLLGAVVRGLGAGRERVGDPVDWGVGLELFKKVGQRVRQGEPLLRIHYNEPERLERVRPWLEKALRVSDEPVPPPPLLRKVVDSCNV